MSALTMEGEINRVIASCRSTSHVMYFSLGVLSRFRNVRADDPNKIGGPIIWNHPDRELNPVKFGNSVGNPPIQFDDETIPNVLINIPNERAEPVDQQFFPVGAAEEIIVTRQLEASQCASLGEPGLPVNPVFAFYKGNYFIHDPRFVSQ